MYIPPHWGIFFTLIVSFLVFWFIFNRLFFRPFLQVLSDRERKLKDLSERTAGLVEKGRTDDEERERRLAEVRRESMERREAERRRAESEAAEFIEKARSEARTSLDQVSEKVAREVAAAEGQLEQFARSLAGEIAERVLGRPVSGGSTRSNN